MSTTENRTTRTKTPRIINPAPANRYGLPGERIIQFNDGVTCNGGLISFMRIDGNDGRATLRVRLFALDADVEVLVHQQSGDDAEVGK